VGFLAAAWVAFLGPFPPPRQLFTVGYRERRPAKALLSSLDLKHYYSIRSQLRAQGQAQFTDPLARATTEMRTAKVWFVLLLVFAAGEK
jgi:hypothetical protein